MCILRNTNFAAQKYDIINSLIHRAFLPRETRRPGTGLDARHGAAAAAMAAAEHHSLATVTLDNQEEAQFRAVTWSVLFAMAEEALPATILKLAFVEIPQRLFDSLFLMGVNSDGEFRLNSLVLLHRLLLNGLSFTGHVAKRESRETLFGTAVLSKGSLGLLAKLRSAVYQSFRLESTGAPHICAIDGILKASLGDTDLQHCVLTTILLVSLQEAMRSRPLERQVLTQLLLLSFLQRIGRLLGITEASAFAEDRRASLRRQGVHVFDLEGALDDYPPPLCIRSSSGDPVIKDTAVTFEQAQELLLRLPNMTGEQGALIRSLFTERVPYSSETDLETIKEAGRNEAARRSLFPASPKRPLAGNAGLALGSESASSTLLAHHRHSITGFLPGDGSQTIPAFTKHSGASSTSVASSTHLSRASSMQKKAGPFRSLNASADSLSLASSGDSQDSATSVLEGDFANLTLRNQERDRELRERSTSILQ